MEEAFRTRELLKVKVQEAAALKPDEAGEALAARLPDSRVVFTIGRTLVLFRPHPEKPEIQLP